MNKLKKHSKLVQLQIEKRQLKYDLNKLKERMKEIDEQISKLERGIKKPYSNWIIKHD